MLHYTEVWKSTTTLHEDPHCTFITYHIAQKSTRPLTRSFAHPQHLSVIQHGFPQLTSLSAHTLPIHITLIYNSEHNAYLLIIWSLPVFHVVWTWNPEDQDTISWFNCNTTNESYANTITNYLQIFDYHFIWGLLKVDPLLDMLLFSQFLVNVSEVQSTQTMIIITLNQSTELETQDANNNQVLSH